jgi:hypothetical protein
MPEHIPIIFYKEENIELVWPISEGKISLTIWSLGLDKTSIPDVFSMSIYKTFWDMIKYDLKRMLQYSHQSLKLRGSTNYSFLYLIPKESNPSSFARFMPIS